MFSDGLMLKPACWGIGMHEPLRICDIQILVLRCSVYTAMILTKWMHSLVSHFAVHIWPIQGFAWHGLNGQSIYHLLWFHNIFESTCNVDTYVICDQWKLRCASASGQSKKSLHCLHARSLEADDGTCENTLLAKHVRSIGDFVYMSPDINFPTMWYRLPAKAQTSLHIRAVWSESLC